MASTVSSSCGSSLRDAAQRTGGLAYDSVFDWFFVFFFLPHLSQRRRAVRQQQSRKVGVRYYETHNVKNRNRNKKKTNDSEGQKHKHKKSKQKQ